MTTDITWPECEAYLIDVDRTLDHLNGKNPIKGRSKRTLKGHIKFLCDRRKELEDLHRDREIHPWAYAEYVLPSPLLLR
jgi:hypothetical protein